MIYTWKKYATIKTHIQDSPTPYTFYQQDGTWNNGETWELWASYGSSMTPINISTSPRFRIYDHNVYKIDTVTLNGTNISRATSIRHYKYLISCGWCWSNQGPTSSGGYVDTSVYYDSTDSTNTNIMVTYYTTGGVNVAYTIDNLIKHYFGDGVGNYITDITSTNPSEYPLNGKHSDGYWYIRQ